jgi:hypothetical protein
MSVGLYPAWYVQDLPSKTHQAFELTAGKLSYETYDSRGSLT